jgi:hypothetical protein
MEEPKIYNKYLVSLTKIVSFYCLFFVLLKSLAIVRGAWVIPNLILTVPFVLLGISSAYVIFYKKYNWVLALFGALFIILIRYYEVDLVYYLQEKYGTNL